MGWAVGEDSSRRRHIGYGVPATCDYPGCGARIDRGISHACGGGITGSVENCGLFFCLEHLSTWVGEAHGARTTGEFVCERCADGEPPFEPTPDTAEWIEHVLIDASWAEWRTDNPEWANEMLQARSHQIG